jgi:hypothetical protein
MKIEKNDDEKDKINDFHFFSLFPDQFFEIIIFQSTIVWETDYNFSIYFRLSIF